MPCLSYCASFRLGLLRLVGNSYTCFVFQLVSGESNDQFSGFDTSFNLFKSNSNIKEKKSKKKGKKKHKQEKCLWKLNQSNLGE